MELGLAVCLSQWEMCWVWGCSCGGGSWLLATVMMKSLAPSSLCLALWGGQEEETPAKFNAVISVKGWNGIRSLENPALVVRHVQLGVGSLTESLELKMLIKVQDVAEMLRLIPIFNHRDNIWRRIPGEEGVGVVVGEVGRAPPRFKRIFIVRFTPTSASPSAVPLRPHPGGSVCARGAAPPSAPRTVPVCCSPSVIPLTRPSLVTPPYLSLTPEPVSRVHARKPEAVGQSGSTLLTQPWLLH